ncbi:MAG TPA: hypothetical protein VLA36_16680 [Longimicrobiales bacterium]|nr:hypothetical protein [Longimicrobiales bacterium]
MCRAARVLFAAVLLTAPGIVAQDLPEASPDAIAAHVEGLRAYLAGDNLGALPHFYRAHEIDPTFYVPVLMAAVSTLNAVAAGNAGMTAVNDSLWDVVAENRFRFSDYYQRRIDVNLLRREGRNEEALELAREAAAAYPGTKIVYNYSLYSLQDGRPKAALEALATLDPDREPMKNWISFFSNWCNAAHFAGDFSQEERCGRTGSARFPANGFADWHVAVARASEGRLADVDGPLEEAMSHENAVGGWIGNIGTTLWAHGYGEAAAKPYLEKAVAWYQALPPDQAQRPAMRRQGAYWLYASGRYDEARSAYEGIVADLGSVADRGYFGITSALAGDRATAAGILDEFMGGDMDLTAPQRHYWAGLLCAAMGDRDRAAEHLSQTWSGTWDHHEPVLIPLRDDPVIKVFLAPRG